MDAAWALLRQGRWVAAKEAFSEALREGDDEAEAWFGRALAYAGMGRRNRAARDLASAIEEDEDRLAAARAEPSLAAVLRDPHLIRALDPDEETALGVAVAALYEGDADGVLEAVDPWLEEHPDDAAALYLASTARAGLGDADEAVALARAALALDPDLIDARFNLGSMLADEDDAVGAEAAWREALSREPDHFGCAMRLLLLLRDQDRHAESADVALAYLAEEPRDTRVRYNLAVSYAMQGQGDAAFEALTEVVALDPGASEAIPDNPHFAPWLEEPRWVDLVACDHLV